ncbi:MAG: hypothetical protein CVV03_09210 [Firmicutes bacterium HGW-Firmicutes-8]|nr:MAG: hypothetical protein CVV03_09210 [Firmicutes bacterium HGW-Firmicutes-8]
MNRVIKLNLLMYLVLAVVNLVFFLKLKITLQLITQSETLRTVKFQIFSILLEGYNNYRLINLIPLVIVIGILMNIYFLIKTKSTE